MPARLCYSAKVACDLRTVHPSLKETHFHLADETSACADKHLQSHRAGYHNQVARLLLNSDFFELFHLVGDCCFNRQTFH